MRQKSGQRRRSIEQNGSIEQISRKPGAKRPINMYSDKKTVGSFSLGT